MRITPDDAAQLRSILASALDPIVTIDLEGTILGVSDSVERVFGWTPAELMGRNVSILAPEPHRSNHDGYLAKYRETGLTSILGRTRELEGIRKDGHRFPIDVSVSRADVPGRDRPLLTGIIHDITDRRRTEEELAKHQQHLEAIVKERTRELESSHEQLRLADRLASIGTLAAGLGHDMNNVLLPIRSRLDVLEAMNLATGAGEHLAAIRASVAYLQQLTDGLHLMALDTDDAEASAEVTDLRDWWEKAKALLGKVVPKEVAFHCDLAPDLPPAGIPTHRLTQAVLNLVVNAGEAVPRNGSVRIRVEPLEDGRFVRLSVMDDGPGMTPEVRRHALEPFFTTKRRGLGTGLGLSLVHGVVQAAGGGVEIDSEPGRGTTVTLLLPALLREDDDALEVGPTHRAAVSLDDPRIASLFANVLRAANTHCEYGQRGAPADIAIWITEPSRARIDEVRDFLAIPSRQVILCTADSDAAAAFADIGAIVVGRSDDFELVRQSVGEAVRSIAGVNP